MDNQEIIAGVETDAADPVVADQEQSQAEHQSEMVPVTALQAERRERQQLQEQMKMLQDHMTLMQSNQKEPEKVNEMDGLTDDDVLTVGEAKKFLGKIQQNYQTSVEELRVQQKYSDYNEVVSKYLPEVVSKNPALKTTLQSDPNRYELAYYLARNSDSFRTENKQVKQSTEAKKLVENAQKAGNLSSIGSTAPKSQISAFKDMSDTDFMKMANKNLGRF